MNKINFAIWDHKEKKLYRSADYGPAEFAIDQYGDLINFIKKSHCDEDNYTVLRSTQIKSSNRIVMIEGDIIRFNSKEPLGIIRWDINCLGFVIEFITKNKYRVPCTKNIKYFEVVGNIFEQESLKDQLNISYDR